MKKKSDLMNTFARLIFRYPYSRLFADRQAFCRYHADAYFAYRETIARKGKEIRRVNSLRGFEYDLIWKFYTLRICCSDVLSGMAAGVSWATEQKLPVSSIGLFSQFVYAHWRNTQARIRNHLTNYGDREIPEKKDTWLFTFFRDLYLKYNERYFFDPFWGYFERERVFAGVKPGSEQVVLTTDCDIDELKYFAGKLNLKGEYNREPLPHFRLTRSGRALAILLGAIKADRAKMEEIEDIWRNE